MEKRKFKRFRIDQMIGLGFGKEEFIDAKAYNVSLGGIHCESTINPEEYNRVDVVFEFPLAEGVTTIECEADMAWIKKSEGGYRFGLSFYRLSEADQARLKEYLDGLTD